MKAILLPANGPYSIVTIPDGFSCGYLAGLIDCEWIEIVRPRELPEGYCMIVDEEGLLNEKPFNPIGSSLYGYEKHGNPIVGDVLILKEEWGDEGSEFAGMTENEAIELLLCVGVRL